MMVLIPETKTGVVVVNNLGSSLPTVVAWDRTAPSGLEPEDYLAETKQRLERSHAAAEEKQIPKHFHPQRSPLWNWMPIPEIILMTYGSFVSSTRQA